jgi:hypothetical protein
VHALAKQTSNRLGIAAAAKNQNRLRPMNQPSYPLEALDAFEIEEADIGAGETEARTQDAVFSETEEMELAEQLLEIADERELDRFVGTLLSRALGEAHRLVPLQSLRRILRQAAKAALPAISRSASSIGTPAANGVPGGRVAAMAGNLLGLELEGVGGEEQQFELARHFVRFAGNSARNFPHFHASAPAETAAQRAVGVAVLQELYESARLEGGDLLDFEYPLLLAEDEELDYFLGNLLSKAGKAIGGFAKAVIRNPIKAVRDAATDVVRGVADVSSSVADTLGKIPIIGAGLKGLYGFTYGTLIQSAADVASGVRLDKVVSRNFERQLQNVKDVAPYVQTIISFVPGVGPGISGAISAGLSLAQGKPLDQVMVDAALGALPGGPLVKSMAQMAVAAASGKPLSDIAISALPISPGAKEGLKAGLRVAADVAQGKRVDKSLLAEANRQIDNLPPQFRKAAQIGVAIGQGKKLQDIAMQQLPSLVGVGGPLARAGQKIALLSPIFRQARSLLAKGQHGFDIAQGLLARSTVPSHEFNKVRNALKGPDLKGFDTAVALHKRGSLSPRGLPSRQAARATALALARNLPRRRPGSFEVESPEQFESGTPESGDLEGFESGPEDRAFGEAEEMELGAKLLEITDANELDGFVGNLIARATGGSSRLVGAPQLRAMLSQAAKRALPMIGDAAGILTGSGAGGGLAAAAGNLFGLELEGLSPEDQEFEVARRFVRFAGASAKNARRLRGGTSPTFAAQRAVAAAARRHAPGFLRRGRPRSTGLAPDGADFAPTLPIPIEVTCNCCGAQQSVAVPGTISNDDGKDKTLPDTEPANSTEPQSQQDQNTKETNMHDLDRTAMEISDEADFEFSEAQDEYRAESPFSEEEEAEHAAQLLEINDEAELDHFLGSLLNVARNAAKARGFSLANLNLRSLGGFLKGAIKKALPIAGGALGNLVAPGIGGQIGSRLASGAGDLLGFEYEALAPEDQEFEVAKRMVRMAGAAVQNAAQAAPTDDPQAAAKAAVVAAAQAHVPGLLQSQPPGAVSGHHHPRSGTWYRHGRKILLVGV